MPVCVKAYYRVSQFLVKNKRVQMHLAQKLFTKFTKPHKQSKVYERFESQEHTRNQEESLCHVEV